MKVRINDGFLARVKQIRMSMGIRRENGYSASVAASLSVGGQRVQVAKMNRDYLTLADACELRTGN